MAGESKLNLKGWADFARFTENLCSMTNLTIMRILIVEDKRSLAGHIGRALEGEGHKVALAYDGDEALRLGKTNNFDLMILDVMLPRRDGFTVIKKLREEGLSTQTIIASARDSMEDIIHGLDAGADDYLTKPFALDVLLAKVRAASRRVPTPMPQTVQFEDLVLRPHLYELQRGNRVESLTRTECALIEILMRRVRAVVPHGVLIQEGWGTDADVSFDSLYVFIRALRGKITHPGEPELLHTIRGVGYSLRNEA
jgi:DNA-binding response OmpR family regulator